MHRRLFLTSAASSIILAAHVLAQDSLDAFDAAVAATDFDSIAGQPGEVELSERTFAMTESQGGEASRRKRSDLLISDRALDLIVSFEVSSKANYEKRLQSPILPAAESGITIGIGYDLGYLAPNWIIEDWQDLVSAATLQSLIGVSGATRGNAAALLPSVKHVVIPWDAALSQFQDFLPYIIAETGSVFPNLDKLSADSRGALVSLVYNRGSSLKNTNRRMEMREIAVLMREQEFEGIPAQIRSMKRIWVDVPDARGLLERRDLEALLFEAGL